MADSNDIRRNVVEHACSSKNTKDLTAADVAILKNYAVQLRKANIAQEQKIMKQDTKIHSQKQKIKGLKSKLRDRDAFIDSERKRLDDQMRVNNEDQKSLYALEKQIKRVEDTYNKTRTLVCKVVPEMFLFALKQKAVEKARAARMFYNGTVEQGGAPSAYEESILHERISEARDQEAAQMEICNSLLSDLQDEMGASLEGAWKLAEHRQRVDNRR